MDWFSISASLLNNLLQIWKDERARKFADRQKNLVRRLSDELAKPLEHRDQNRIDHIYRELWLLSNDVTAAFKVGGQDSSN